MATRLIYKRSDAKWACNLTVNGQIVATNGNQGYVRESDATSVADRIIGGEFGNAGKKRREPASDGA